VNRAALDALLGYAWPGNIRELENVIERAVVLARADVMDVADLPEYLQKSSEVFGENLQFTLGTPLAEIEERLLRETLRHTKGDKQLAAQLLGISVRTIYRKIDGRDD
jgi:two-component system response regulator HydG